MYSSLHNRVSLVHWSNEQILFFNIVHLWDLRGNLHCLCSRICRRTLRILHFSNSRTTSRDVTSLKKFKSEWQLSKSHKRVRRQTSDSDTMSGTSRTNLWADRTLHYDTERHGNVRVHFSSFSRKLFFPVIAWYGILSSLYFLCVVQMNPKKAMTFIVFIVTKAVQTLFYGWFGSTLTTEVIFSWFEQIIIITHPDLL